MPGRAASISASAKIHVAPVNFVRPSGEVAQRGYSRGGGLDGLAHVERVEPGEDGRVALDQVGEAVQ
jgi:hypothetical protein